MLKYLLFIILFQTANYSQLKYAGEIGSFSAASSFHVNSAGFFFVTDAGNDKLYKIDTLGNVIKETGGYGWSQSSFDVPNDVFATPLNIYVADKNNHRIQMFDKDLNFISSLSTRNNENKDLRFGYPLSCTVTNQGDLFILDSENKRIVKFDLFGNFSQNFGGYDWGKYALSDPSKLACDPANNIYASDGIKVLIYDQFGNGIGIISAEEEITGLNIIFSKLTVNTTKNIYIADLSSQQFTLEKIKTDTELNDDIISSIIFNNKLYVLTKKRILIFSFAQLSKL